MYVLRGFDRTTPSFMMPIPSLLALPSKPIATTIAGKLESLNSRTFNDSWVDESSRILEKSVYGPFLLKLPNINIYSSKKLKLVLDRFCFYKFIFFT